MKKGMILVMLVIVLGMSVRNVSADEHAILLIPSDTTDGSTVFEDKSGIAHQITANGDVHHSTTQSKFGSSAIYFDGNGDYLSIPDSEDWNFGSGDFTIDFWVRFDSWPPEISHDAYRYFVDNRGGGTEGFEIRLRNWSGYEGLQVCLQGSWYGHDGGW